MKKLIIIRGASGVGKSSVAELLARKLGKGTAHVPVNITLFDLIIDYLKFPHTKMINLSYDNAEALVRNFLRANFTVVTDHMFARTTNKKSRLEKMIQIGKRNKAKVYVFELHADLSMVRSRAKQRARQTDIKTNYKKIDSRYKKSLRTRHKNAIIIDTADKSVNQTVNEIMKRL